MEMACLEDLQHPTTCLTPVVAGQEVSHNRLRETAELSTLWQTSTLNMPRSKRPQALQVEA